MAGMPTKPDYTTETYQWVHSDQMDAGFAALPIVANPWPCKKILVQNSNDSASTLLVGNALGQHIELQPGQSYTIPLGNANLIYVSTSGGAATVNYHIYQNRDGAA